jgi:hypothetical protein
MFEDEFEEYDRSSHRRAKYVKNKKQQYKKLLDSVSVDVYRDKFNNDHIAYWKWVFRFEDEPKPYVKPEPIIVKEIHPFEDWI